MKKMVSFLHHNAWARVPGVCMRGARISQTKSEMEIGLACHFPTGRQVRDLLDTVRSRPLGCSVVCRAEYGDGLRSIRTGGGHRRREGQSTHRLPRRGLLL